MKEKDANHVRIDGVVLSEETDEVIREEATNLGLPFRTYLRVLILKGAKKEGIIDEG